MEKLQPCWKFLQIMLVRNILSQIVSGKNKPFIFQVKATDEYNQTNAPYWMQSSKCTKVIATKLMQPSEYNQVI